MKRIYGNSIAFLLLTLSVFSCAISEDKSQASSKDTKADLIVKNGKIATVIDENEFVEAFAVKGGKFIAVGNNVQIEEFTGKNTKVIDAKGKTVIPGLNDSHTHLIRAGLNYNMELRGMVFVR